MTLTLLAVLAAALALAWWVAWRAIRFRREAEIREARVLEALFVARHTADGGALHQATSHRAVRDETLFR